jgi:hypothetical protein
LNKAGERQTGAALSLSTIEFLLEQCKALTRPARIQTVYRQLSQAVS